MEYQTHKLDVLSGARHRRATFCIAAPATEVTQSLKPLSELSNSANSDWHFHHLSNPPNFTQIYQAFSATQ